MTITPQEGQQTHIHTFPDAVPTALTGPDRAKLFMIVVTVITFLRVSYSFPTGFVKLDLRYIPPTF